MRRLFFGLIVVFFLELAGMILLGQAVGVLPVLLLLVAGAVLGVRLLRTSGMALSSLGRVGSGDASILGPLMAKGLFSAIAGLLLIFPGFLTDVLAGLVLLPPVGQWFAKRFVPSTPGMGPKPQPGPVIEGEAYEIAPVAHPEAIDQDERGRA